MNPRLFHLSLVLAAWVFPLLGLHFGKPWRAIGASFGLIAGLSSIAASTRHQDLESLNELDRLGMIQTREFEWETRMAAPTSPWLQPSIPPAEPDNWIESFLFNRDGSLRAFHVAINGPTGTGKTTLATFLIDLIRGNEQNYQTLLINPKHIPSRPVWMIPCNYPGIDEALEGLKVTNEYLKLRANSSQFDPDKGQRLFVVVDEWDWIHDTYGQDAIRLLRPILKVGRELRVHLILCGQSSLTKDNGLSGADNRNFSRIILGNESKNYLLRVESNPQMLASISQLIGEGKRAALLLPVDSNAQVAIVPDLKASRSINSNWNSPNYSPNASPNSPSSPGESAYSPSRSPGESQIQQGIQPSSELSELGELDWCESAKSDAAIRSLTQEQARDRIIEMKESKATQKEIIQTLWGLSKGGHQKWKSAVEEYKKLAQ